MCAEVCLAVLCVVGWVVSFVYVIEDGVFGVSDVGVWCVKGIVCFVVGDIKSVNA